jgi:hypothetical protein
MAGYGRVRSEPAVNKRADANLRLQSEVAGG